MKTIKIETTENEYNYIMLVARRKAIDLKEYILDNFEWDGDPECIGWDKLPSHDTCDGCEHFGNCPDKVG